MKKLIIIGTLALLPFLSYGQGMFSMSYDMSFGVGSTANYISAPSFRGVTFIDARSFISSRVSIGGSFAWNVFYEDLNGTFEYDNVTATGSQYRYINSFPILATTHYYFGEPGDINYYIGTGIGTYSIEQRTDMGLFTHGRNKWHFGIQPQVGVLIPVGTMVDLHAQLKYNQTFKAGDYDAHQYFTFSLGLAWW